MWLRRLYRWMTTRRYIDHLRSWNMVLKVSGVTFLMHPLATVCERATNITNILSLITSEMLITGFLSEMLAEVRLLFQADRTCFGGWTRRTVCQLTSRGWCRQRDDSFSWLRQRRRRQRRERRHRCSGDTSGVFDIRRRHTTWSTASRAARRGRQWFRTG